MSANLIKGLTGLENSTELALSLGSAVVESFGPILLAAIVLPELGYSNPLIIAPCAVLTYMAACSITPR